MAECKSELTTDSEFRIKEELSWVKLYQLTRKDHDREPDGFSSPDRSVLVTFWTCLCLSSSGQVKIRITWGHSEVPRPGQHLRESDEVDLCYRVSPEWSGLARSEAAARSDWDTAMTTPEGQVRSGHVAETHFYFCSEGWTKMLSPLIWLFLRLQ